LHDEDPAHANIDCILERGRLLTLDGPSMRTKDLGLDEPTAPEPHAPVTRLSETDVPEFSAPQDRPIAWPWTLRAAHAHPGYADATRALQQLCPELRLLSESAAESLAKPWVRR